jgi:hypothetical protein
MDPALKLAFDEILRKLDEFDGRMEQRWRGAAVEPCTGGLKQSGGTQLIIADNWGGLFDEIPVPEERVYEPATFNSSSSPAKEEQLTDDAHIVADNWGGEFGEPVHAMEKCDYEPAASDAASPLPVEEQLAVDAAATEYNSNDSDAPARITSAPTASVPAVPAFVETSPAEYEIQIWGPENPSPRTPASPRVSFSLVVPIEQDAVKILDRGPLAQHDRGFLVGGLPTPRPTRLHRPWPAPRLRRLRSSPPRRPRLRGA